ncbi:MAG TPA: galactose-1-phosphate uridylyltransferase [Candidatus Hypogeohydataceae bacterium YC40]
MPELRLNLVTREWCIIAPERSKRPETFKRVKLKKELRPFVETCPFCPGNEAKTPPEVFSIREGDSWKIRVIPNKFPALAYQGERERINDGLKRLVTGVGIHEVIIETPLHHMGMALLPLPSVADVIRTYKARFLQGYKDSQVDHIIIFRNHGEDAGTTLEHPHSQLIGLPVTPIQLRDRLESAAHFYDYVGRCLLCMSIEMEKKEESRLILETDQFISFIPYAASTPFHTWIVPKRHAASFGDITE